MSIENLRNVFRRATRHEIQIGLDAYHKYQRMTSEMAEKYGFSARVGAAVFAALSPSNDYHGNLRDAHNLLRAAGEDKAIDDFVVSTYGQNKRKAWAIVHGTDPLDLIIADKTRSFFLNIADPTDPDPVTVDGHMYNIWRDERISLVGLKSDKRLYQVVAQGVRELARDSGYIPCQVQSVLWLTWRRIHGILTRPQLEMWDADYIAARLEYKPVVPTQGSADDH